MDMELGTLFMIWQISAIPGIYQKFNLTIF